MKVRSDDIVTEYASDQMWVQLDTGKALAISLLPDWLEGIPPLAMMTPATPVGSRVIKEVLHRGEAGNQVVL